MQDYQAAYILGAFAFGFIGYFFVMFLGGYFLFKEVRLWLGIVFVLLGVVAWWLASFLAHKALPKCNWCIADASVVPTHLLLCRSASGETWLCFRLDVGGPW